VGAVAAIGLWLMCSCMRQMYRGYLERQPQASSYCQSANVIRVLQIDCDAHESHHAAMAFGASAHAGMSALVQVEQLADGLWTATQPLLLPGGDAGLRLTAMRMADGSLWVRSLCEAYAQDDHPGRALPQLRLGAMRPKGGSLGAPLPAAQVVEVHVHWEPLRWSSQAMQMIAEPMGR
jgi:hypothetical protein